MAGGCSQNARCRVRWGSDLTPPLVHMLFLTIGTLTGFDRLVRAVDNAVAAGTIRDEVFAQIGPGPYIPKHMKSVKALMKD
jgi:hypothetical protein